MLERVVLPKEAIKGLKLAVRAGVRGEYPSSIKGTPQGGVISPLLANIALDGLEKSGSDQIIRTQRYRNGRKNGFVKSESIRGIRYADDAVFICYTEGAAFGVPEADIQQLREDIDKFLESS